MAKDVKSKEVKPLATDEECRDRRDALIAAGIIKVDVEEKPFDSEAYRRRLIASGTICPLEEGQDGKATYCELPPRECRGLLDNEEGEYKPTPIMNDKDYERRCQVYFRMLQEIIWARKKCKLNLGPIEKDSPSWFF